MSTIPKHRQLPDKENKLFKEILVSRSSDPHQVGHVERWKGVE